MRIKFVCPRCGGKRLGEVRGEVDQVSQILSSCDEYTGEPLSGIRYGPWRSVGAGVRKSFRCSTPDCGWFLAAFGNPGLLEYLMNRGMLELSPKERAVWDQEHPISQGVS